MSPRFPQPDVTRGRSVDVYSTMDVIRRTRSLVFAGVGLGVLVGGVGGRLAMLILRLTSPDSVTGVISDDGFEIGQVTLLGTLGLLVFAAVFGLIGAAAYALVRPWLIGPPWFRNLTCALGAGAVVGSALIHADGVDFTLLKPTWLAIALFVAIPASFGALIGPVLAWCDRPSSWVNVGKYRPWILLVVALAVSPANIVLAASIAVVMMVWRVIRGPLQGLGRNGVVRLVVRGAWLAIALLGLTVLLQDIQEIRDLV
jgi:hypothetical protein